jgi:hypothetical protein
MAQVTTNNWESKLARLFPLAKRLVESVEESLHALRTVLVRVVFLIGAWRLSFLGIGLRIEGASLPALDSVPCTVLSAADARLRQDAQSCKTTPE